MKITVGKLEIEIPEATLGDVEDAAELEKEIRAAAERQDFDALVNGYLGVVVVMARSENAGVTVEKLRRALPFRPARRLDAAAEAYRATLRASGVTTEEPRQGEAERP
jgi:hypothetical protein